MGERLELRLVGLEEMLRHEEGERQDLREELRAEGERLRWEGRLTDGERLRWEGRLTDRQEARLALGGSGEDAALTAIGRTMSATLLRCSSVSAVSSP